MFVYLDESGNLTPSKEDYFIVASFTVGDPTRIAKAFRRWQRSKLPKKLRGQPEIKFNDPHIDDKLRMKTIKYLAKQDIRIFYTYLKKKNIPEEYHREGKVYETGLLYTEIVVATLDLYLPVTEAELIVMRDKRSLKGVSTVKFNKTIKTSLLPKLPAKIQLTVHAVDSSSKPQVQIADWIGGAFARYHEKKPLGEELYIELKRNIIQGRELFSDYWMKK